MAVKCIDLSTWQVNVDFEQVKRAGITAVIIRAGYGREQSQKDNQFENHYRGAKAVGMKLGAYWYSYARSVDEAALEAKACLACIKGKAFDLPVYFDMEEASQTRLGKTLLTQMAEKFCDTVTAGGYRAGVYANPNWFINYLDYDRLRAKYSIWLAHWASAHSIDCDIWQYSGSGTVAGIGGNVDMDLIENPAVIGGAKDADSPRTAALSLRFYTVGKEYAAPAAQIKTVQRLLNWLGYRDQNGKALKVNGKVDGATDFAIREYQKKHALAVDGIVGEATWKLLTGAR